MASVAALSAHEVGKRLLLSDVHHETLDELLHSLRTYDPDHRSHNPVYFGIPPLDRLILQAKPEGSSASVVEITSTSSSGGKTHLVYLAVAVAVLPGIAQAPAAGGSVCKQGKSGTAVVIDADGCFDVERLADVMKNLWAGMNGPFCEGESSDEAGLGSVESPSRQTYPGKVIDNVTSADTVVENAVQHVHVVRPQSLSSLVATVQSLPGYLFDSTQHFSSGRTLELLAIDSLSAFYWQEKLEQESAQPGDVTAKTTTTTSASGLTSGPPRKYDDLISALRHVQGIFHCPILTTTWGLQPTYGPQSQHSTTRVPRPSFKPTLPPSWQTFRTLRLGVTRETVKQFHVEMTLEQAERDRSSRQEVMEKGRFVAWVDLTGSGAEGITGTDFGFWIRDGGVELQES